MGKNSIIMQGKKTTSSFVQGFLEVFTSLKLVGANKGLTAYFIVPFILNIIVLSSIFYFSYTTLEPRLSAAITGSGWIFEFLKFIIAPLILIVLAIITVLIYSIIGNIITSPFNDFLSLKVETIQTGEKFDEPFSLSAAIDDIVRVTGNILRLLGLLIVVNAVLLVVNLIPVAGSFLYTVMSFMTTVFFLGFQFFDFPLERRRYTFREKLSITMRYKMMVAGVGTGFFLVSYIPLMGFLGLNMATMGATSLFVRNMKPVLMPGEKEQK